MLDSQHPWKNAGAGLVPDNSPGRAHAASGWAKTGMQPSA